MFPGDHDKITFICRAQHLKDKRYISKELNRIAPKANIFKIKDWKKQGQDLRNIFQKPVERPVIPEKKYQFEWEEEPDTNRSFSEIVRSFSRS